MSRITLFQISHKGKDGWGGGGYCTILAGLRPCSRGKGRSRCIEGGIFVQFLKVTTLVATLLKGHCWKLLADVD